MTGDVEETYVAAIQHDLVDLKGAAPVGVVRRPTGWFRSAVDENLPALGPPEALLDELKDRQEELGMRGLCDEEAHNAAWEETDFEDRYRTYLAEDPDAEAAVRSLLERLEDGEDVALVCFEADDKRCHRHAILDVLERRLDRSNG